MAEKEGELALPLRVKVVNLEVRRYRLQHSPLYSLDDIILNVRQLLLESTLLSPATLLRVVLRSIPEHKLGILLRT